MPVSVQSRIGDQQQLLEQVQHNVSSQMRGAMPGIIQSFDPDKVTAVVQPVIKGSNDGKSVMLPLLLDIPVVFPGAGGVFITFPVNPGDECELSFNDRCIDFFWQNGGVQEPADNRMHDLSDATCRVGQISQPNRIKNISTTTSQFRSADGSTYFELDPETQKIKIVAPGGLDVDTPLATFSQAVTIKGLLSWLGGMVGSAAKGVAAQITGAVEFIGSVKANGKSIDETHKHGGVQRGGSDTDEVS